MKKIFKITIVSIVAAGGLSVFGIAIHDRILENATLRAFRACDRAELENHRELLCTSLEDASSRSSDFQKKAILFHKKYVSNEACRFVRRMTKSSIVKEASEFHRHAIYDYLYEISLDARFLNTSLLSTRTFVVSRFNSSTHRVSTDNEISSIQKALTRYSEDLVLYDVICRSYYSRKDYKSVIEYGLRSAEILGDDKYERDIVYLIYLSSCALDRLDDAINYIGFAKEALNFSILDYELNDKIEL